MMNILTLEQIMNESKWVAKMQGWRKVGTYEEVKPYADSNECRDFDLCAGQPKHLADFFDRYFKYEQENGWITIPDFYNDVYLVQKNEEQAKTPITSKKVWTEEEIKNLVQTNDKVLYGALKKLYAQQTADEQRTGDVKEHNGRGFNSLDARILSSFAEFLLRTGFLTYKQKLLTRRKLVKYTKQLTRLANT